MEEGTNISEGEFTDNGGTYLCVCALVSCTYCDLVSLHTHVIVLPYMSMAPNLEHKSVKKGINIQVLLYLILVNKLLAKFRYKYGIEAQLDYSCLLCSKTVLRLTTIVLR